MCFFCLISIKRSDIQVCACVCGLVLLCGAQTRLRSFPPQQYTAAQVVNDVSLTFNNAIEFNMTESHVHREALRLRATFSSLYAAEELRLGIPTSAAAPAPAPTPTATPSPAHAPAPSPPPSAPRPPAPAANKQMPEHAHAPRPTPPRAAVPASSSLLSSLAIDEKCLARLKKLVEKMCKLPDSVAFREPVNPAEAPGYFDMVKSPMDLGTLKVSLLSCLVPSASPPLSLSLYKQLSFNAFSRLL